MKSTITNDMVFINGIAKIIPKEYPNWYGIKEIGFIWHGEWADPEIEYKGRCCSCYVVEDTMWERFKDDFPEVDEDMFDEYMWDNQDQVKELCELALFSH